MPTQTDVKHKLNQQYTSIKESASKLGKKFTHSIKAIDDTAKNKPWQFMAGCAAGVGLLLDICLAEKGKKQKILRLYNSQKMFPRKREFCFFV